MYHESTGVVFPLNAGSCQMCQLLPENEHMQIFFQKHDQKPKICFSHASVNKVFDTGILT